MTGKGSDEHRRIEREPLSVHAIVVSGWLVPSGGA